MTGGTKMKATGQIRRIDDLGRVVVPKEVRVNLGIRDGDAFEIFTTEDRRGVVFQKYSFDTPVAQALKSLRVAVEDSELSCRKEFLQSITELEARLKLEEDE
jgi:AbrB family looped-hinge helix DNA binding protein